jgi:hypothetical protein
VRRDDGVGEMRGDKSQIQRMLYTLGRGDVDVGVIVITERYYFQLLDMVHNYIHIQENMKEVSWKYPRTKRIRCVTYEKKNALK